MGCVLRRVILCISMALAVLAVCTCLVIGRTESAVKSAVSRAGTDRANMQPASGVCPPIKLRDEQGRIIDPVHGVNDKAPYSPKQTCGAKGCHDYNKITQGFHFTQGKGEKAPATYAARYRWVTSPGNYGGNWCSPAPLYRQLAPKRNANPRTIDMTSFDFVTATCGNCHPGGGPLEYDRDGKRYDERMLDPALGLTPGGDNGLDGDYFKAQWSKTGVIEADCLLCHMPEYDYKRRNAQLADLNFKWAATQGAGFATVSGKVKDGQTPTVAYDLARFDEDGNAVVHIAPEPRNETCLHCHAKPDWKKKGASYTARTDVHIMAGLRCVDCHAAGSKAADPRIRGKEVHQFGKGDDPSGAVRNDLDNTVRTCEDCHLSGWRNAPRATHDWLPPLHLKKLSCQACHIPNRTVKSALVQASDVNNPAPRITPPAKHIWTFYDQEMSFWNHYGELDLFTPTDEPTNVTRPTLIRYKGKTYPGNRVHSAWVGYEEEGKPGLNQLFMKDFYGMWKAHADDPNAYPQLGKITDDNKDGIIEVNRPEEIDALLAATREHLTRTKFPLEGKRLVWVSDSRAYYSSSRSRELGREPYEATAYASVYKFSHDIAPAKAALGSGGCTDCHGASSAFFTGAVLDSPFAGKNAQPVWKPNYTILGISPLAVRVGMFRENTLKPALYTLLGLLCILVVALTLREVAVNNGVVSPSRAVPAAWILVAGLLLGAIVASRSPGLVGYMTFHRFSLDAHHFWVGSLVILAGAVLAMSRPTGSTSKRKAYRVLSAAAVVFIVISALCGGLMILDAGWLERVTRYAYTGFDVSVVMIALISVAHALLRISEMHKPAAGEK